MTAIDPEQQADPTAEYGVTGLSHAGGRISEEWLPALRSAEQARKVFTEMADNDPTVGSLLFAFRSALRQIEWSVEPADTPTGLEDAVFIEECLDDMSHTFDDLLTESLSMLQYGWALHEVVYKVRGGASDDPTRRSKFSDGRLGWRKMPLRAQETLDRWEFDDADGLRGMWQRSTSGEPIFLPIEKCVLFRTSSHKGNPEGRSLLRNAYRPWWLKKRIEEHEAIGIERDLVGIPVIGVPPILFNSPNADHQAALEEWKRIGKNLRMDDQTCVIYPLGYDGNGNPAVKVELLHSAGSRTIDTGPVIARYERSILMTVLADVVLLGHEKIGTQALADSKTAWLVRALQSMVDAWADTFNQYAIERLFMLNAMPRDEYPHIAPGSIERPTVEALAGAIGELSRGGITFADPQVEQHLRVLLGLPEMSPEMLAAISDTMAGVGMQQRPGSSPLGAAVRAPLDQQIATGDTATESGPPTEA